MSEAEAGPGRIKEEPTSPEMMEPASVKKLKEDRRSSSVDTSGDQELSLQTICYDGKTLKLPSDDHMHQVMYRILKNVYHPLVDQILVGLPQGWADPKKVPTNAEIVLYTKSFNIAAKPYAKNWRGSFNTETLKDWGQPRCTVKVASDITTFAYECAVPRPADLNNHYKSFSSETYGETNLNQMASIIDELGIGPSDVFVDLGSGIGQLVCFTAAYAGCKKAVGIELSPKPAEHAADLAEYFKRLMKHFGKQCSKFELIKGNFLDPQFKKLICDEATVIFINNYAFGPDLMFNITNLLLQDLKHGTRIVTTKPFGQNKREITFRSTSDINSMSDTIELKSLESGVSWTANKVTFWLTTMDHTKLIRYYEEEQRKKQDLQSTSREGSEFVERETPTKKRKADRDNNVRDKHKMEHTAKKPREESRFASSSTSSGAITATAPATDNNNMPSTSSSAQPAPPAVIAIEEDVFFGRTTRKMWKAQTEQAAASQPNRSPKWNEQDTEYVPSAKKPKKNREGHEPKSSIDVEKSEKKKKKEKVPSTPKTPKTPKHSKENRQNHSVESSGSQDQMTPVSHPLPSLAKATAPPPTHQDQKPKIDESIDISEKNYGNFDAKTMKALNTIREAASTSTQAAAIQDAIDTVLSHPESPPNPTMALPPGYPLNQNIQAPVAVYPQPHIIAPPPPPPSNIIPPSSEILVEQRHTFMIPPTDPFYQMVVSTYFEFKNYCHQAKTADPQIIIQLRHEIESEKARQNDLHEAIGATNAQIEYYLNKGVNCLKNRLDELGMTSVNDVSELLSGSKQIVTQHKSLTTDVHQMETNVMLEEQKLKMIGGPEALRLFDEAIAHVNNLDVIRLAEGIVTHRPINYTAHSIQVDDVAGSDAKVSPSRRSRNPKPPRTTNPGSGNGKRGASATRKADGTNEKMEMEIREFVKHAMQVDHAVKEKERKARSNLIAASERLPRKVMDEPSSSSRNNNRSNFPEDSTRASARGKARSDGRSGGPPRNQVLPPPPPEEDPNSNRKRSRTAPNPNANHAKMPRKETDVVDRIWHDIDEEQREKQAKKKAAAEEAKRTEPPVTSAGTCLELTVANLKNFKNEDSTVNDFISREGMVDRLLGYKMLLGKMENCSTLGYEKMNDKEISELSSEWFKKFHPNVELVKEEPQRRGPRTPSSPPPEEEIEVKPRRGPQTPPGSPGPSNQPHQVPANRREMVEQLARTFGQSTHEVEEALGDQLDKALEDCSKKLKNEMMETFKATIKKMMEKKGKISSDLSDQMELVSDTSLSVDMKIVKKEETEMPQYHLVVPPPPIPPNMQPNYAYYQPGPPVYQYPPPPAQPVYQQNIMCYGPPVGQHYAQAPPQMHYQMQPSQPYQHQQISTMVLPPVNVPPPPMGVRIDTPMPQQIPPVIQALPPTAMPPPPIPPQGPPPPMPPLMAPQQSAPPQFTGDCWRPNPPPPQTLVPSDSWQQQTPVAPVAPPVSAAPLVAGVQTTLFSALGLHKPPPPPPPPSGSSAPPFASLSAPPPPPPPPIVGPSPSSLNFPPPPPPPSQPTVVLSSPTSNGYRHHGSSGRVPPFSNPYKNF